MADGAGDRPAAASDAHDAALHSTGSSIACGRSTTGPACFVVPFALDLGSTRLQPVVDAPVVGLLGSMHWPPSRSAAERLLTRIWSLVEGVSARSARLLVAGWNAQLPRRGSRACLTSRSRRDLASPTDFLLARLGARVRARPRQRHEDQA
mgnify:CR=1 FL=1